MNEYRFNKTLRVTKGPYAGEYKVRAVTNEKTEGLGFTGTLALLDEMMEETAEEKSRRRSALKYEYFRTMTPYGNI